MNDRVNEGAARKEPARQIRLRLMEAASPVAWHNSTARSGRATEDTCPVPHGGTGLYKTIASNGAPGGGDGEPAEAGDSVRGYARGIVVLGGGIDLGIADSGATRYDHARGIPLVMSKRRGPLIAALVLVTVCAFSTLGLAHSHGLAHDEAHCICQLCHIQHAAVPQPSAPAQVPFALRVVRFATQEQPEAIAAAPITRSNPRAPPA